MAPGLQAYAISFGPFCLVPSERRLTRDGEAVELGSRALDILIALLARPNEVISKTELLSQVWPNLTVEEGSLRFHMANLRKALGDGKDGARYITTVAGRGYGFVAPISRSSDRSSGGAAVPFTFRHANLPPRLARMVGRADDVLRLATLLSSDRFITIVGPGGIGKTTVAIAVGHNQIETFAGAVLFADLGMLSDPKLVPSTVASLLGLSVQTDDATENLVAYLRDKRLLLVLDTCEHLIEAVAALSSRIFMAAPQIHILATSREALQVEGEYIYRLDPLACPPDNEVITAEAARTFSATALFIDRATASGARREFSDAEIAIVSDICRKLDGVALAIELAARRVDAYGLEQIASLLDQHVTLLWPGQRSAPERQKTLQATLDWSFRLLPDVEQLVLRRLAVFIGHFSMDAALAVVAGPPLARGAVFGAIDSLVAKSMVALSPLGHDARLFARNQSRPGRAHRAGRAPCCLFPTMAGAGRDRLDDLADPDRTRIPLCRSQQRARSLRVGLWTHGRCQNWRRPRRCRSADFPGNVSAYGMSPLVQGRSSLTPR
jgi:predicted ATPase/DNA-binding winged helix-turn-helix (wHTH) protein